GPSARPRSWSAGLDGRSLRLRLGWGARTAVQVLERVDARVSRSRGADRPCRCRGAGHGRDAGNAVLDGRAANLPAVRSRPAPDGRVYEEVDVTRSDPIDDVRRSFADLVKRLDRDTHRANRLRRPARGEHAKAEVVHARGELSGGRLVGVANADEDAPLERQGDAGSRLGLGKCGWEVLRDPHHLAGRLHLRTEEGVRAVQAPEREHRFLYAHVARPAFAGPALIPKALP